jgi:hypothetical protein
VPFCAAVEDLEHGAAGGLERICAPRGWGGCGGYEGL